MVAITTPEEAIRLIRENKISQLRGLAVAQNFKWGEVFTNRIDADIVKHFTLDHAKAVVSFAQRMQWIRQFLGNRSITVTSWWRDVESNKKVGGKPKSRHLLGDAVDFVVSGLTPQEVQKILDPTWNGGLGYGKTFTHVDGRATKARFGY